MHQSPDRVNRRKGERSLNHQRSADRITVTYGERLNGFFSD
jgi:hypothetical protein